MVADFQPGRASSVAQPLALCQAQLVTLGGSALRVLCLDALCRHKTHKYVFYWKLFCLTDFAPGLIQKPHLVKGWV